jgi:hypothetical protein
VPAVPPGGGGDAGHMLVRVVGIGSVAPIVGLVGHGRGVGVTAHAGVYPSPLGWTRAASGLGLNVRKQSMVEKAE